MAENTQPEELTSAKVEVADNLESAFNVALKQLQHCDNQIVLWTNRRQEIQNKLNEAINRVQKTVSNKPDEDATIADMIQKFLEKNGPARTIEIRKHLLSQGRNTNPGVALNRMVKKGAIKPVQRGLYKIA